jgi:hypothetical protein
MFPQDLRRRRRRRSRGEHYTDMVAFSCFTFLTGSVEVVSYLQKGYQVVYSHSGILL